MSIIQNSKIDSIEGGEGVKIKNILIQTTHQIRLIIA